MCSFGSCTTRFEFLSQFRKVRNAFECFVTQVQTRLPKAKRVWPMKINVICTVWKGDVLSFKSTTTHAIIEFNPVFLIIVASHIRPRAMIMASFTSMSVKDCDHRSQPDVRGNNDQEHRIKPLNISLWYYVSNDIFGFAVSPGLTKI